MSTKMRREPNERKGNVRCRCTTSSGESALHFWEEPCISGERGSGTVFFSGCSLGCIYCQNGRISRGEVGKFISRQRLVEIFFELEQKGAHNINLVTAGSLPPVFPGQLKQQKVKTLEFPLSTIRVPMKLWMR